MAFTYQDMGCTFHMVFSVMAGWIVGMLFILFFAYTAV